MSRRSSALTPEQYEVCAAIAVHHAGTGAYPTQLELCGRVGIGKSTMQSRLGFLLKRGIVGQDGAGIGSRMFLTPKGRIILSNETAKRNRVAEAPAQVPGFLLDNDAELPVPGLDSTGLESLPGVF